MADSCSGDGALSLPIGENADGSFTGKITDNVHNSDGRLLIRKAKAQADIYTENANTSQQSVEHCLVVEDAATTTEVAANVTTGFQKALHDVEQNFFVVGMQFDSYESILERIKEYEMVHHVKLFRRDSRTIQSIIAKGRSRKSLNLNLKYGELNFRCRFGGKDYKTKSTGVRPKQRCKVCGVCFYH